MKSGMKIGIALAAVLTTAVLLSSYIGRSNAQENTMNNSDKLLVVWTSADKDVAIKMVYMYTYNAKKQGWFDTVQFLIWGPSSKLLAEDKELQDYIGKMKDEGVILTACKACADMYGVSEKLESMDIDVKYMGKPLTDILKSDWKVLTF